MPHTIREWPYSRVGPNPSTYLPEPYEPAHYPSTSLMWQVRRVGRAARGGADDAAGVCDPLRRPVDGLSLIAGVRTTHSLYHSIA